MLWSCGLDSEPLLYRPRANCSSPLSFRFFIWETEYKVPTSERQAFGEQNKVAVHAKASVCSPGHTLSTECCYFSCLWPPSLVNLAVTAGTEDRGNGKLGWKRKKRRLRMYFTMRSEVRGTGSEIKAFRVYKRRAASQSGDPSSPSRASTSVRSTQRCGFSTQGQVGLFLQGHQRPPQPNGMSGWHQPCFPNHGDKWS